MVHFWSLTYFFNTFPSSRCIFLLYLHSQRSHCSLAPAYSRYGKTKRMHIPHGPFARLYDRKQWRFRLAAAPRGMSCLQDRDGPRRRVSARQPHRGPRREYGHTLSGDIVRSLEDLRRFLGILSLAVGKNHAEHLQQAHQSLILGFHLPVSRVPSYPRTTDTACPMVGYDRFFRRHTSLSPLDYRRCPND